MGSSLTVFWPFYKKEKVYKLIVEKSFRFFFFVCFAASVHCYFSHDGSTPEQRRALCGPGRSQSFMMNMPDRLITVCTVLK